MRWWYYTAIVLDFFLRFVWVGSLVPPADHSKKHYGWIVRGVDWLAPISMLCEVARRTMWGLLRLEVSLSPHS